MLGKECSWNMPYGEETAKKLAAGSCRFDAHPFFLCFLSSVWLRLFLDLLHVG